MLPGTLHRSRSHLNAANSPRAELRGSGGAWLRIRKAETQGHASLGLSVERPSRRQTPRRRSTHPLQLTKHCLPTPRLFGDESLHPDHGQRLVGHIIGQEKSRSTQMLNHGTC